MPDDFIRQGLKGMQCLHCVLRISIGNYTVREVLMKNRTRVWRNIYNTHERYYKYFAKHKCDFSLILREQV